MALLLHGYKQLEVVWAILLPSPATAKGPAGLGMSKERDYVEGLVFNGHANLWVLLGHANPSDYSGSS